MGLGTHFVEAKIEACAEPRVVGRVYLESADMDLLGMEERKKALRDPGEVVTFAYKPSRYCSRALLVENTFFVFNAKTILPLC